MKTRWSEDNRNISLDICRSSTDESISSYIKDTVSGVVWMKLLCKFNEEDLVLTRFPAFLHSWAASLLLDHFFHHYLWSSNFISLFSESISLCSLCFKSWCSLWPASTTSRFHFVRSDTLVRVHLLYLHHHQQRLDSRVVLSYFPPLVRVLCYVASSESNHQIVYYPNSALQHIEFNSFK